MLIPVDKLEAPFKALGRAVSSLVSPQAAPQQTPTAQTEKVPVDKLQPATNWYNLASAYYDQAAKEAEDKQKREIAAEAQTGKIGEQNIALNEQALKTGEFTAKTRAEKEADMGRLRSAYEDYVNAPAEKKEQARQKLITLESVVFMKPLTTRAETQPPAVKEILDVAGVDPESAPSSWPKAVKDKIEQVSGLPFQKFNEQLLTDRARRDKDLAQQENWRFNREQKQAKAQDKISGVFSRAMNGKGGARDITNREMMPLKPTPVVNGNPDRDYLPKLAQWQSDFNKTLYRHAHEEYDWVASHYPELSLPPLGEGDDADANAYKMMLGVVTAGGVSRIVGDGAAPSATPSQDNSDADAFLKQHTQ